MESSESELPSWTSDMKLNYRDCNKGIIRLFRVEMTAARKWNDSNFHWNVSVSFIKLISNHLMIFKWRIRMYQWRIWHFKQIRRCSLSVSVTFIDPKWLFGLFIFKFKVIESFSPVLRPFDEDLRVLVTQKWHTCHF